MGPDGRSSSVTPGPAFGPASRRPRQPVFRYDRVPRVAGRPHPHVSALAHMQELLGKEARIADQVMIQDPPASALARLEQIQADPLFQASFSDMPTSFKVVEIDKIVAPQRDVNLDYVSSLAERLTDKSIAG